MSAAASLCAGCEEHRQPAVGHAPEYLHEALSGNIAAQANLADCLAAPDGCVGVAPDPALACAWRGVRLASGSPELSLADEDAYHAVCGRGDETARQRQLIVQEDLTRRIYHRPAPVGTQTRATGSARLYPSIETVRERVNQALAGLHADQIPRFETPRPDADRAHISWRSCTRTTCLEGVAPRFGGGLFSYRITVKSAPAPGQERTLAGELVGAGLEAPGIAHDVFTPGRGGLTRASVAGVCWTGGVVAAGGAFAAATAGTCAGSSP